MTPTETSELESSAMASFAPARGSASRSKVKTIVADPPWQVNKLQNPGGGEFYNGKKLFSVALEYPTMPVAEIAALPVKEYAENGAHLYLWTVNKYIEQAYTVARAWGFQPSTMLYWCKRPRGLVQGGTFVPCVEPVLFCRRGSLKSLRRFPRNWWEWTRGKHSAKPEAFTDMVMEASPGPYLELFARRERLGWATWGNEALCHVGLVTPNL